MNIEQLRRDTPGCEEVLHLDHAGSSLLPRPVLERITEHLQLEARWGGYRAADAVRAELEQVYADVGALIGCGPSEVALVDSATRAWQLAFASIPFQPNDRILCSRTEYASNHLAFLQLQRRVPVEIVTIPPDETGAIDLGVLADELEEGAALVALTHVPTNGGLVHPAHEVGELCRSADVPFLLDACQAAGQVDLRQVRWDLLAATGRKYLRGPRGTGFLGVRKGWLEHLDAPLMDLHGATWTGPNSFEMRPDARRFELWERSFACTLGLGRAVRYALECGIEALEVRIAATAQRLRSQLAEIPGIDVRDLGAVQCGIVTFEIDGLDPAEVKAALRRRDVHVSVSRAPSTLLDMRDRGLEALLRASVHALTTDAELDSFIGHLHEVRAGLSAPRT